MVIPPKLQTFMCKALGSEVKLPWSTHGKHTSWKVSC